MKSFQVVTGFTIILECKPSRWLLVLRSSWNAILPGGYWFYDLGMQSFQVVTGFTIIMECNPSRWLLVLRSSWNAILPGGYWFYDLGMQSFQVVIGFTNILKCNPSRWLLVLRSHLSCWFHTAISKSHPELAVVIIGSCLEKSQSFDI